MGTFRTRKSKNRNFFTSWFFVQILGFLLSVFIRSTYASFTKKNQADLQRERYAEEMHKLEMKKKDLEAKIEKLKTERGKEEEYRKRYNVVKEGETMIRIIEE